MTRIEEFTTNKPHSHIHLACNHYHHHHRHHHYKHHPHHHRKHQQNSMRRQLRRRVPSIVLLLASCLVFVVLLKFEYGNCSQVLVDTGGGSGSGGDRESSSSHASRIVNGGPAHHNSRRHRTRDRFHRSNHHQHHNSNEGDEFVSAFGPGGQFSARDSSGGGGGGGSSSSSSFRSSGNEVSLSRGSESGSSSSSSNQQVPEQALPIVVSSSDNSYVSASPIETPATTTSNDFNGTNHRYRHPRYHIDASGETGNMGQQHKTRLRPHHYHYQHHHNYPPIRGSQQKQAIAPRAFKKINNNEPQQQQQKQHGRLLRQRLRTASLTNNKERQLDETEVMYNGNYLVGLGHSGGGQQQQQLTSSSDISTTATTTQRNKIRSPPTTTTKAPSHHHKHNNNYHNLVQQQQQRSVLAGSPSQDGGARGRFGGSRVGLAESSKSAQIDAIEDNNDDNDDDDDDDDGEDTDDFDEDVDTTSDGDSDGGGSKNNSDDYGTTTIAIKNDGADDDGDAGDQISTVRSTERMQTRTPADRSRPDVAAHYNIGRATIIKTRESIQMGATFINYTLVSGLNACLVECWITDNCDTAIYQEEPVDFSNHLPHLISSNKNKQQLQVNHNTIPGSEHHRNSHSPSVSLSSLSGVEEADNRIPSPVSDDDADVEMNGEDDDDDDDDEEIEDFSNNINIDSSWLKSPSVKSARENGDFVAGEENNDQHVNKDRQQSLPEMGSIFICYLFQCAKPDGFKCQFSAHNYYVSSIGKQEAPSLQVQPRRTPASIRRSAHHDHRGGEPENENDNDDHGHNEEEELQVDAESRPLVPFNNNDNEPHYSNLINGHHQHQNHHPQNDWFTSGRDSRWGGNSPHVASIKIGQEEDYGRYDRRGGLNGAIIAMVIGVCATGILIMIVGHKMKTIRKKIAYKGRRRSLVPDADFLINTMPI